MDDEVFSSLPSATVSSPDFEAVRCFCEPLGLRATPLLLADEARTLEARVTDGFRTGACVSVCACGCDCDCVEAGFASCSCVLLELDAVDLKYDGPAEPAFAGVFPPRVQTDLTKDLAEARKLFCFSNVRRRYTLNVNKT